MNLTMDEDEYPEAVLKKIDHTIAILQEVKKATDPAECGIFLSVVLPDDIKKEDNKAVTLILGGSSGNSYRLLFNVESGIEMLKEALRETLGADSHLDHQIGSRMKAILADITNELQSEAQQEEIQRGNHKQRSH